MVWDVKAKEMMTLRKAMETNKTQSKLGFKGIGKTLALTEELYSVNMDEDSVSFLKGAQKSTSLIATFAFKVDEEKKMLTPHSAGVYLAKMLNVSALYCVAL